MHGQFKGPGVQQQGSPLLSALLSAYPFTAHLIAQLVTTNMENTADFILIRLEPACCAVYLVVELHALFGPVLFPLLFSVDILLNRSQQLFASCTAKFADGQQCSIPVFDITHQTPLCEEHAKKMVITMMFYTTYKFYMLRKTQSLVILVIKLYLDKVLQNLYKICFHVSSDC